ncbi:MAG: hypothetical protein IKJ27_10580 [Clostridia bacterium]|nr:hypothetical protein [Clostridia bacterium]
MTPSDWIAGISLVVAIAALIYTIISNTKKYELTYQYYQDVVAWHSEVVKVITQLKSTSEENSKNVYLAELSALIETGRFYFPNIDLHDGFGANKPLAYRGYRNVVLDFLVYEYQLFEREDSNKYVEHAESLQRLFTSYVFQYLNPKKLQKKIKHNTSIQMKNSITINEFLKQSPESIYTLYPIDSNEEHWKTIPSKR